MHAILDEIILGGQVLETSSSEVVKAVEEISMYSPNPLCFFSLLFFTHQVSQDAISYFLFRMERAANSLMAVPSITGWQGR